MFARRAMSTSKLPPQYSQLLDSMNWSKNIDSYTSSAQFKVATFNLLAPCYKRILTGRESGDNDGWKRRATRALEYLKTDILPTVSILALQELWLDQRYCAIFEETFRSEGFHFCKLRRTGQKLDAVAIIIKEDSFIVLGSENVYLCSQGDRVALIVWLRHRVTGKDILVASTHLSFPHSIWDKYNQVRQMETLTEAIDLFAAKNGVSKCSQMIMGDFNVETRSPVCDLLREQGYFSSFEVCAPDWNGDGDHAETFEDTESPSVERIKQIVFDEGSPPPTTALACASSTDALHITSVSQAATESEHKCAAAALSSNSNDISMIDGTTRLSNASFALSAGNTPGKFVSHRTHKNEDLGVDHIFFRPEITRTSATSSPMKAPSADIDGLSYSAYQIFAAISSPSSSGPSARPVTSSSSPQTTGVDCLSSSSAIRVAATATAPSSSDGVIRSTDKVDDVHATSLPRDEQDWESTGRIFATESEVMPRFLRPDIWHEQFNISDHRPVSTTFVLAALKRAP